MKKVFFDPNTKHVLAWIDTAIDEVNSTVPESQLLAITDTEWELNGSDFCYVVDGKLIKMAEPPTPFHIIEKGKWVISQSLIDAQLALSKINALTRIDHFHADVISRLVGNPTQTEKDTWAMKLDTANAIAAGQTVAAAGQAFLKAAGLTDTAAQSAWSRTVLAKSTGYAQVVGVAERLRDAAKTAVKAAADEAGVQAALDAQHAAADAAVAAILKA